MRHLETFCIIILIGILLVINIIAVLDKIPSRSFTITPEEKPVIIEKEKVGFRIITAYNAVPEQTDDTPCISASGLDVCNTDKKICASNEFPFGTLLLIENEVWEVQDRTNSRYSYRIDLLVSDYDDAMQWGNRTLEVIIIIIENKN